MEPNKQPRNKPLMYGQLTFDKGAQNIHWRNDSLFNKWSWESWLFTCNLMQLDPSLTPFSEINLKWIKELDVRLEPINS